MNAHMTKIPIETLSYNGLLYEKFPSSEYYTWDEALEYQNKLREKSFENWRLATIDELEKLFTLPKKNLFKKLQTSWSSTEERHSMAWVMNFSDNIYHLRAKDTKYRVICVRDTALKRSINFFK